jgi:hypothetical protein
MPLDGSGEQCGDGLVTEKYNLPSMSPQGQHGIRHR